MRKSKVVFGPTEYITDSSRNISEMISGAHMRGNKILNKDSGKETEMRD